MDAAASHMERLLKRARVTQEEPSDASFLPFALALACLVRHPPPPLSSMLTTSSSALLLLSDPVRTPPDALDKRLRRELSNSGSSSPLDERLFESIRALMVYVRTVRGVLAACSSHLKRRTSGGEDDACLEIISVVLREVLAASEPSADECVHADPPSVPSHPPPKPQKAKPSAPCRSVNTSETPPSGNATVRTVADAAGIVKRAVGRDAGNGAAILDMMDKFPSDERIQIHSVRAAKGVVSSLLQSVTHQRQGSEPGDEEASAVEIPVRRLVGAMIDRMVRLPSALALQRDGLLCLRDVATIDTGDSSGVCMITALGGVAAIVNALARLPDDLEANGAGLAVLAHPAITDDSTVRVDPESRRFVLSAMRRFPLEEQIQGLGALALGNLSLRDDTSCVEIVAKGGLSVVVAAMTRFAGTPLVQASGCRFIAIVSTKDEQLAEACLQAGALPASEKARVRFPGNPKVQQYATEAIQGMLPSDPSASPPLESTGDAGCALQ